jgi:hypothetical protein
VSKNQASIIAVMGASGSGKSAWVKRELARTQPSRLMIWDSQHEYADHGVVCTTLAAALAQVQGAQARGRIQVVYQGAQIDAERFDVFCKIAYAAGNLTLVVEELAFVTRPERAPPGWASCTLRGRHRGLRIYGASQRPASIDKHFFGNATLIHAGRLNFEADVKTLANVLQVTRDDIVNLRPLDWIERDMQTGRLSRGTLSFATTARRTRQ